MSIADGPQSASGLLLFEGSASGESAKLRVLAYWYITLPISPRTLRHAQHHRRR